MVEEYRNMRIAEDVWDAMTDYSGLENLPVYGNFLTLYTLPAGGSIAEVGEICSNLKILDERIFALYVSYVLSKSGYYMAELLDPEADSDGMPDPHFYTTKFKDEDWLELADYIFYAEEEGDRDKFSITYENDKKEQLRVFFLNMIYSGDFELPTDFIPNGSYFVIHPRLFKKASESCQDFAETLRQETGCNIVLSTGQLADKFLRDKIKRQLVEANWESLRSKIYAEFQNKWKILVYSLQKDEIDASKSELQKAQQKLDSGIGLEDAALSAGIACEGFLRVLHSTKPNRIKERMSYDEYLCDLTDLLTQEFGEDIVADLNLIREWRNSVAHAPRKIPDTRTTVKIVTRAKLFEKLFEDYIQRNSLKRK
jgi:hypothetical protein